MIRRSRLSRRALLLAAAVLTACDNPADNPAPIARMEVVSGDLQTDTVGSRLPLPLVIRVVDEDGDPVYRQVVNFVVTEGGGTVFAGASLTNADGRAQELWTLGPAAGDTQRVEVRAVDPETGLPHVYGVFRAVGTPGAPVVLERVSQETQFGARGAPLADSLAVRVEDEYGNAIPGAAVTWTPSAGGAMGPAEGTTNAAGIARARWTLSTTSIAQTARASIAAGAVATFQAMALATENTRLTVIPLATTGPAGAALPDSVRVRVINTGNGMGRAGVRVAFWPGAGGSVSHPSRVTDANGWAATVWTLGPEAVPQPLEVRAGEVALTATAQAYPGGGVAQIVFLSPPPGSSVTAGAQVQVQVVVRDAGAQPVVGVPVTWTAAGAGGSSISPQTTTDEEGNATTTLQVGPQVGGTVRVTATAGLITRTVDYTVVAASPP